MIQSPRDFFQKSQVENRDELAKICKQPPMRNAIIFAMAEMVHRNATFEQLQGAKMYADILTNLGEPTEEIEKFPTKELKHI